jgi:hypothetical protein
MLGSFIHRRSFFISLLKFRVGSGDLWARFAQPEAQIPEHVLAPAHTQTQPMALLYER